MAVNTALALIAIYAAFCAILFVGIFWTNRKEAGIFHCPACDQRTLLVLQTEEDSEEELPSGSTCRCFTCLSEFNLWHPQPSQTFSEY